jgi:hypothetical protein
VESVSRGRRGKKRVVEREEKRKTVGLKEGKEKKRKKKKKRNENRSKRSFYL